MCLPPCYLCLTFSTCVYDFGTLLTRALVWIFCYPLTLTFHLDRGRPNRWPWRCWALPSEWYTFWRQDRWDRQRMGCNCAFPIQVSVYFENLKIILYHIIYESLKQLYFTCFCWRIIKVVPCCCFCQACWWWYVVLLSCVLISHLLKLTKRDWCNALVLDYRSCVGFCMSEI